MDHLRQDLLAAVRKYPVACCVAILSLVGGLGAMTATLGVRNVLFRNPPPLYPSVAAHGRRRLCRRSKEFVVRIAVGASAANLVQLVAAQSAKLVGMGLVLGLGLMWALRQFVRSAGRAGSSFDPQWRAFVTPILVLAVIGVAATWQPTRRARRIDPAQLLRS